MREKIHTQRYTLLLASVAFLAAVLSNAQAHAGWVCSSITHENLTMGLFNQPLVNPTAAGMYLVLFSAPLFTFSFFMVKLLLTKQGSVWFINALKSILIALFVLVGFVALCILSVGLVLLAWHIFTPDYIYSDTDGTLLSTCTIWNIHIPLYVRVAAAGVVAGTAIVEYKLIQAINHKFKPRGRAKTGAWSRVA